MILYEVELFQNTLKYQARLVICSVCKTGWIVKLDLNLFNLNKLNFIKTHLGIKIENINKLRIYFI